MRGVSILLAAMALVTSALATTYPSLALSNFLLVATTSPDYFTDYARAPNVSATSLFDPFHQEDFYLRLTGPGYLQLPRFNLTTGSLVTKASRFPNWEMRYQSAGVQSGKEFVFRPAKGGAQLSLEKGYLVSVHGESEGWTICDGTFGEKVIFWQGRDANCVPTYLHAAERPPY